MDFIRSVMVYLPSTSEVVSTDNSQQEFTLTGVLRSFGFYDISSSCFKAILHIENKHF